MAIELAKSVRVVFLLLVAMGSGWTQQRPAAAKHASDIRAEQTRQVIAASPACQKAIADPKTETEHTYRVPAAAFLPNLESLMEKSDEVVLSGIPMDGFSAVSPSGEDAIEYVDVKTLETWKGSHRPGDVITFELPTGTIGCSLSPYTGEPLFTTLTGPGWVGLRGAGPMVLFLRHSQGTETQLTPSLRLTGGGVQGMFEIDFPTIPPSHGHFPPEESGCRDNISAGKYPENLEACLAFLRSSAAPVLISYPLDPLVKGYGGMAIADFLTKVQEVADSLGYEPPE